MADASQNPRPTGLGYAELALDRCAERRHDPDFFEAERKSETARAVLLVGDKAVLKAKPGGALDPLFAEAEAADLAPIGRMVFLGRDGAAPRFAAALEAGAEEALARQDDLVVEDLRALAGSGRLVGAELALAGYAKSMLAWHARNGFCANCGSPTAEVGGGWRRDCPNCGAMHFPRVDPVVIMLVTRGDSCLLGRQPRFPPNMYSCLAGFVEPGETAEDAARREIREEAGVRVGQVSYMLSQPWPFPSQLMIGVRCEALSEEITPDPDELDDARWFSREEARQMLSRTHPAELFVPPPSAIAHHLLKRFAEE